MQRSHRTQKCGEYLRRIKVSEELTQMLVQQISNNFLKHFTVVAAVTWAAESGIFKMVDELDQLTP